MHLRTFLVGTIFLLPRSSFLGSASAEPSQGRDWEAQVTAQAGSLLENNKKDIERDRILTKRALKWTKEALGEIEEIASIKERLIPLTGMEIGKRCCMEELVTDRRVMALVPGGPAEQGGFRLGDKIQSVNGRDVRYMEKDEDVFGLIHQSPALVRVEVEKRLILSPYQPAHTVELVLKKQVVEFVPDFISKGRADKLHELMGLYQKLNGEVSDPSKDTKTLRAECDTLLEQADQLLEAVYEESKSLSLRRDKFFK